VGPLIVGYPRIIGSLGVGHPAAAEERRSCVLRGDRRILLQPVCELLLRLITQLNQPLRNERIAYDESTEQRAEGNAVVGDRLVILRNRLHAETDASLPLRDAESDEHADHVFFGLEALLNVERSPRAGLLIFRNDQVV